MYRTIALALAASLAATPLAAEIRIAHVYGKTGPLEAYAKQSHDGLMLGLEYATDGTMEIDGEPIVVIEKDTQLKPDIGKALLAEAYGDDDAHIAVGPVSSGVALAMLPVAQEYERLLIVEPAVADSITGENWNRYIFRTGRNSSQDAISNAVALGGEGVTVATLAQDYAFGRDGVAAFKEALEATGATVAHEEYVPTDTTDFTAAAERIFQAMGDIEGEKKLFIIWAGGGNPMGKINAMDPSRFGIEIATGGNILAALTAHKELPGMEGATYYYYEIPQNPVNEWLVKTHFERHGTPPDFFTAGGMSAGMAIVEAIRKAGGAEDTEALITAMEGMEWETPKGTMRFRPEDHQALQTMYHFRTEVQEDKDYGVPVLVREIGIEDMNIPVRN
ncbi:substrate-binding domain-containing protein [Nitratireductor aquimarinus]|uniref:Substrate-binding domain-containing protein n=1 Tax=Nitratireductor aquimarinus TaxID=889300 RepID=A0ABU4AMF0_9HYPH|nr:MULTISPECIES: substrate-binding domain-containing protein [Alphaproteobacteria]MBY6022912.1 substrate-binding domain-containing protein [Nitratireductor sp. DP7N14-4]MBN7758119.1 substrate-binding domain-containing protein [Nitratireductor aquimarinus]MBN7776300.1 substrate-binding domain-containing protein [Nitratireductor pacificus]MBN7779167.1 substrate-binding domain-containing protein [Nitratireductor pacificus]MBN7787974.1 substrate-binding domain-containing protein [Nitratireductor a